MTGRENDADAAMWAIMKRLIKKEVNEIVEQERKRIMRETIEDGCDRQKNGSGTQYRFQFFFEMTKIFGENGENIVFNNSLQKATNLLACIRDLWKKKPDE